MTYNHAEQLTEILEGLTSYSGSQWPAAQSIDDVNATAPKFFILPLATVGPDSNTFFAEKFQIQIKADSEANLITAYKTIIACKSSAAAGYDGGVNLSATAAPTTFSRYDHAAGVLSNGFAGDPLYIGAEEPEYICYLQIPLIYASGSSLSGFSLSFVNSQPLPVAEGNPTMTIKGLLNTDGRTASGATADTDFGTFTTAEYTKQYTETVEDEATYTFDTADEGSDDLIDIINEILTADPSKTSINLRLSFASTSNTNYAVTPRSESITFTTTGHIYRGSEYPYWIDIRSLERWYNNNEWYATLECEARWSLS